MRVGIIGSGADKFTKAGEARTVSRIRALVVRPGVKAVVSGHSPMGGVDIWAEEIANEAKIPLDIKAPTKQSWGDIGGYRDRNLAIARDSDEVHVIVAATYPNLYRGRRFEFCYHCGPEQGAGHVKSGACWTAKRAQEMGKRVHWHVISNMPTYDVPPADRT